MEELTAEIFSKSDKNYKATEPRSSLNTKPQNMKTSTTRYIKIKCHRMSDILKNLKSSQRSQSHYKKRNKHKDDSKCLITNKRCKPENSRVTSLKY